VVDQPDKQPEPPLGESGLNKEPKRKARSDKGQIRFNSRDLLLLKWVGEQYAVRLDSLQVLLGLHALNDTKVENQVSESSARRVVSRWKQEKLVESRKLFYAEPEWVWLTAHGLRHMELPYKPNAPAVSQLLHLHLVNKIRLHVEATYPDFHHWRGERQMRYEHWKDTKFHVPDGEVITTQDIVVAVEIERTLKSRRRIDTIVEQLHRQYAKVWYFVSAETRTVVETATATQREKFDLLELEKYVK
jgi:hypothetical protein